MADCRLIESCCSSEKCEELVNVGYLKTLASNLIGDTCSINVGDGVSSSNCCSDNLSGDKQFVTTNKINDIISFWQENDDPKDDVNGVVLNVVHHDAHGNNCCKEGDIENNQIIKKEELSLKYTEYIHKSVVVTGDTVDPCGGNVKLYVTRLYHRHKRVCDDDLINYNDEVLTAVTADDILLEQSFGVYPYTASSQNNFLFSNFGSNTQNYETLLIESGTKTIEISSCKEEDVHWEVYQYGPTISANFSCPQDLPGGKIPCNGGDLIFGEFSSSCGEFFEIENTEEYTALYSDNGEIKINVKENDTGKEREINIKGTIKSAAGAEIGRVDVTTSCKQESCDVPIEITTVPGRCGMYWPLISLSENPEINGNSCNK